MSMLWKFSILAILIVSCASTVTKPQECDVFSTLHHSVHLVTHQANFFEVDDDTAPSQIMSDMEAMCFGGNSTNAIPNISDPTRQALRDEVSNMSITLLSEHKSCLSNSRVRFLDSSYLPQATTCSVVANGRTAARENWGSKIDGSSLVARCNNPVTDGFEEKVGSRTDVMIINDQMPCKLRDGAKFSRVPKYAILVDFGIAHFNNCDCMAWMLQTYSNTSFFTLDFSSLTSDVTPILKDVVDFLKVKNDSHQWHLTTGMIAGLFMQKLCTEVNFFGFLPVGSVDDYCRAHYWDADTRNCTEDSFHFLCAEKFLWAVLLDRVGSSGQGVLRVNKDAKQLIVNARPTPLQTELQFVIVVPLTFGRVAVVFLPLGVIYLAVLWRQSGFVTSLRRGLRLGEEQQKGAVALMIYLSSLVTMDLVIKIFVEGGNGQYRTSPLVIVPLVESGKLLASFLILIVTGEFALKPADAKHASQEPLSGALSSSQDVPPLPYGKIALLMLPVAAIYSMNNFLVFAVLASVNLDAFAVWRNISILFNAILWIWVMKKQLPLYRWIAIVMCMMACCLNSLQLDGHIVVGLPVALIILSAFASSVASVYNEFVIKSRGAAQLGLDRTNVILYGETLGLLVVGFAIWVLYEVCRGGVNLVYPTFDHLKTITGGGVGIILMQVALGLSVSRVLKYADSVAKTVTASLRDIVLVFVAPLFVRGTRLDWVTICSVAWMVLASIIYFTPMEGAIDIKDNSKHEDNHEDERRS